MAQVQKRTWLGRGPTGHKVRKVAWGYTLQANGKQERKFSGEWTRDDAQQALMSLAEYTNVHRLKAKPA